MWDGKVAFALIFAVLAGAVVGPPAGLHVPISG